ncbi:hypothetical protein BGX29_011648 [Mortierella sp. GBA35]|nr:hypothetical protein BGX29_011648 [Mortierella sp. GBA35]
MNMDTIMDKSINPSLPPASSSSECADSDSCIKPSYAAAARTHHPQSANQKSRRQVENQPSNSASASSTYGSLSPHSPIPAHHHFNQQDHEGSSDEDNDLKSESTSALVTKRRSAIRSRTVALGLSAAGMKQGKAVRRLLHGNHNNSGTSTAESALNLDPGFGSDIEDGFEHQNYLRQMRCTPKCRRR